MELKRVNLAEKKTSSATSAGAALSMSEMRHASFPPFLPSLSLLLLHPTVTDGTVRSSTECVVL